MRFLILLCLAGAAFAAAIEKKKENTEEINQAPSKRSPPSTFVHQALQQLIAQPHGGGFAPPQTYAPVEPTYVDPHQLGHGGNVQVIQGYAGDVIAQQGYSSPIQQGYSSPISLGYSSPLPLSQVLGDAIQISQGQGGGYGPQTTGYGGQVQNAGYSTSALTYGNPGYCPDGQIRHIDGNCIFPEVNQNVFLYRQPIEEPQYYPTPYVPKPKLNKNVVVISTKDPQQQRPLVAPLDQEQTVVYVVNEKQNYGQHVIKPESLPPKDPEVFFISHNKGESPQLPHGINLGNALSGSGISGYQQPPVINNLGAYGPHSPLPTSGYQF